MSSPTNELKLQEVCNTIDEAYGLSQNLTPIVPSNFATLKIAAIQSHLIEEVDKLHHLFSSDTSWNHKTKDFRALLNAHLEAIDNSGLSISALPKGHLNALYFKITIHLFQPQNLAELCEIFKITPTTHIALELPFLPKTHNREHLKEAMRTIRKNEEMVLQHSDFFSWASNVPCPKTAEDFSTFLFIDSSCISLKSDILPLTFLQHRKLYHLTKALQPRLFKALYERNEWFRALKENIETYEKKGTPPREAILRCIRGLELGGECMTGQLFAARAAVEAAGLFRHYLDTIPDGFSENIKALSATNGKTIAAVLNDLAGENCVELAALNLRDILANQANSALLDARPALNQKELKTVEKKYNNLNNGNIQLSIDNSYLPTMLCNNLIKTITLTESHELYILLINFPETFYEKLLRELNLSQIDNPIDVIGMHIEEGFFNERQAKALITALSNLDDKFQNIHTTLLVYLGSKPSQISSYVDSLPNDIARLKAVNEKDLSGRTVLHHWAHNPKSLEKLLTLYKGDEARLKAINEKDRQGRTVLHLVTNNLESLEKLLALFETNRSLQIQIVVDCLRKKIIHFDNLPIDLKRNKEIYIAGKCPCLDYVMQHPAMISASLCLITTAALEIATQNFQLTAIISPTTITTLVAYSSMKFFAPNLSSYTPNYPRLCRNFMT